MVTKNVRNIQPKGWSNPPTLDQLKTDFTMSTSTHDEHATRVRDWLKNLRPRKAQKEGAAAQSNSSPFAKQYQTKGKTRSEMQPQLIRKQAEWRYTSLSEPFLNTPDIFNIDPRSAGDVKAARQNELVLNYQVNTQLNKVAFIDEYVRSAVDEGTAVVRVGWDYKTERQTKEYPTYAIVPAQDQQQIEILQMYSNQHPSNVPKEMRSAIEQSQATGTPHFPVQNGVEIVEEDVVVKNQPTWEVCHYDNVRIDPSCEGDLDKAEFVIYSYETNKADLKKRGIYVNLDEIVDMDVSADGEHESSWADEGFRFSDKPRKKFVVYEYWGYWDIHGNGQTSPICCIWVDEVMIHLEESPFADGKLPFVVVPFMPIKDSIYGEPDGELLKDNQDITGALTRGLIDLFGRSANAQTGFRKGALDVINKRRFERGQDYEFNDMGDAQNSIYMHTFPEAPQSVYNFLQMQSQDAESLTGVIPFDSQTGKGLGNTAAAAQGALSAAARRELGILRRMAEGMKEIGRKFIAMNQQFLDEETVVRITEQEFVSVRRDDLEGNFDMRLTISTAEADEQKAQELSFMLQTTSQHMGQDFTQLVMSEIADLRKMPLLAKKIREFQPQPDPTQQMELQKMQMEIEKIKAETQKILAEAQLNGYKAANTQADTDQKQLDYVEQEAGIAHARDIDKMGAQAEAQSRTKVVEAALGAATQANETKQSNGES